MNKNHYAVLMAGGIGSRFWPVSTNEFPKQFHDMLGTGESLIQKTFRRLSKILPENNILILTNTKYNDLVLEQLPEIDESQVVLEPAMRNTAPCILYAALKIQKTNPDAVMVVAPSDHWIEDEEAFAKDVITCLDRCSRDAVLCTLGITPTFPNTGYGYIEYEKDVVKADEEGLRQVVQFREKPNYIKAREFVDRGNFLWNAGIFMWSVRTIIDAFQNFQPEQHQLFVKGIPFYNTEKETEFIAENYPKAENISIDYAILEHSKATFVLPASFDWNDLGTWGSLYDKLEKDTYRNALVNGKLLCEDAQDNMIRVPKGKLVVIDGLNDYIIIDKPEVLLICPKTKEQDIKKILGRVKKEYGEDYI